jgi:hypothetical protein
MSLQREDFESTFSIGERSRYASPPGGRRHPKDRLRLYSDRGKRELSRAKMTHVLEMILRITDSRNSVEYPPLLSPIEVLKTKKEMIMIPNIVTKTTFLDERVFFVDGGSLPSLGSMVLFHPRQSTSLLFILRTFFILFFRVILL